MNAEELARELKQCNTTLMMGSRFYFVPHSLANEIVKALKLVEERKTGKWIELLNGNMECSECWVEHPIDTNYCPWCGAKMEGVK